MPLLTGITPTPSQFRQAAIDRFGDKLREAAGADGRLTRNEAARIAEREDDAWILADNATNYLAITGQKTVSATKLLRKIGEYAEREASDVAGPNQRLSLVEARSLPDDLQAEFFYLRGKGLPDRVEPQTLKEGVHQMVVDALDAESMTRLDQPPWQVRGERPLIESIPHPSSHTRAIVYLADDQIYLSRAAPSGPGQSLVGWYHVGELPDALKDA